MKLRRPFKQVWDVRSKKKPLFDQGELFFLTGFFIEDALAGAPPGAVNFPSLLLVVEEEVVVVVAGVDEVELLLKVDS